MRWRFWTAVGILLAVTHGSVRAEESGRIDVPIRQSVRPNGLPRYSVPLSIGGGAPVEALLDTGSFGVRVLASALQPAQYSATSEERNYPFGGGARFKGVLATATVAVGEARTGAPILFQLVRSVDCVERMPKCPAARVKAEDYRIAGDGVAGGGYQALLGLSMRRAMVAQAADNPLAGLGARRWIVLLPRPGSSAPGHLVINPDDSEAAGFTTFKLDAQPGEEAGDTPGWRDAALPGCLAGTAAKDRLCGLTLLDTGAPGVLVRSPDAKGPSGWSDGTAATLEIASRDAKVTVPISVGADPASQVHVVPQRQGNELRISAGTLPFLQYAVLYDAKAGTIGFKARTDTDP